MNICPECPDPGYVERTGKCFECIDGEEPLDAEEEIANAPQQTKVANCHLWEAGKQCKFVTGWVCLDQCCAIPQSATVCKLLFKI